MKNIFNQLQTEEILNRIDKLSSNSNPQWGKMDVAQMLAHCSSFQDIAMGHSFPARGWLGILIGNFVKPLFSFQKNGPEKCTTHPHPFFGKLTSVQWGKGIYKHLDHHLKQFGV